MDPILEIVERSNQRSERMLSVVDLIEARTLEAPFAAWLIGRIRDGASWLVGARPGGAGKTTVMSALLAMLPPLAPGRAIRLAVRGTGWERSVAGDCVVAFEIGSGPYEAYIWGAWDLPAHPLRTGDQPSGRPARAGTPRRRGDVPQRPRLVRVLRAGRRGRGERDRGRRSRGGRSDCVPRFRRPAAPCHHRVPRRV